MLASHCPEVDCWWIPKYNYKYKLKNQNKTTTKPINKIKITTSKFHIWVSFGNQIRNSVTPPSMDHGPTVGLFREVLLYMSIYTYPHAPQWSPLYPAPCNPAIFCYWKDSKIWHSKSSSCIDWLIIRTWSGIHQSEGPHKPGTTVPYKPRHHFGYLSNWKSTVVLVFNVSSPMLSWNVHSNRRINQSNCVSNPMLSWSIRCPP